MKLIHLSDLHIGRSHNFENATIFFKRLEVKYRHDEEKPIIVITGDMTDDGSRDQFRQMRELLDIYGAKGYQFFLCPGNHDMGWNGIWAKSDNITRYGIYLAQDIDFPVVTRIGNCHFITVDSMEDEKGVFDQFGSEGEIGARQMYDLHLEISAIEEKFPNDQIIVFLHHHPFRYELFRQLKDSADFKEVIRRRIDILLFGHKHVESRFPEQEREYQIKLILASKKTTDIEKGTLGDTMGYPVFRFLEIDLETLAIVPVELLV